jgi:hypothetical protein
MYKPGDDLYPGRKRFVRGRFNLEFHCAGIIDETLCGSRGSDSLFDGCQTLVRMWKLARSW